MQHNTNNHNATPKRQLHVVKHINQKITKNNAMFARADKGKTTVIIYTHDYNEKVHTILTDNNFRAIPKDPNSYDHRTIQKTFQQFDRIIDRKEIKHLSPPKKNLPHPHLTPC